MIKFITRPYRFAVLFSLLLIGSFAFALLDTFVIPKSMSSAESQGGTSRQEVKNARLEGETGDGGGESTPDATVTNASYRDENIKITIETLREYDTTFYVADIQLSDVSYLRTALAQGIYGRNIKEKTSETARANNAIFAVNGDYYGFRDRGYVLRNGVLYRDTSNGSDALVVNNDGNLTIVKEDEVGAATLFDEGAWQVFSFGPALVVDGEIMVDDSSEVSKAKNSNPRTAVGQVSKLHYIIIVSDGRTDESNGLSLLQLAEQFAGKGCTVAYNLDGGGSSTMYFNGKIVNNPTNGRSKKEREVSDIVYIGYN